MNNLEGFKCLKCFEKWICYDIQLKLCPQFFNSYKRAYILKAHDVQEERHAEQMMNV